MLSEEFGFALAPLTIIDDLFPHSSSKELHPERLIANRTGYCGSLGASSSLSSNRSSFLAIHGTHAEHLKP